jgi:hypothetical protein
MRSPVELTGMSAELMRGGHATAQQRAALARGAALFCEREHHSAVAGGRARPGEPCSPHCVLYGPGAGRFTRG